MARSSAGIGGSFGCGAGDARGGSTDDTWRILPRSRLDPRRWMHTCRARAFPSPRDRRFGRSFHGSIPPASTHRYLSLPPIDTFSCLAIPPTVHRTSFPFDRWPFPFKLPLSTRRDLLSNPVSFRKPTSQVRLVSPTRLARNAHFDAPHARHGGTCRRRTRLGRRMASQAGPPGSGRRKRCGKEIDEATASSTTAWTDVRSGRKRTHLHLQGRRGRRRTDSA